MGCAATARTFEPDELPFAKAREHATWVEEMMGSDDMLRATHSELEQFVTEQSREWGRRLYQENLELRAMLEERRQVVDASGAGRKVVRHSSRGLQTLVGPVDVPRLAYQSAGTEALHPMDATLNLPVELHSHSVQRMVAEQAASCSFDEVVENVGKYTGASIGKRQAMQVAEIAALDFDAFYEQRAKGADPCEDLQVISTDAKGIVVLPEYLREATKQAAAKSKHKLETRLTPGEKRNRKRMAQVATVYSVARHYRSAADIIGRGSGNSTSPAPRPKPSDKRVWASVSKEYDEVIDEAFDEAQRRDPDHSRRWIVLVDGDPKQLDAVNTAAERVGASISVILDFVHVMNYIWAAARALFGASTPDAEKWVQDRLYGMLTGRTGADTAGTIRWWHSRRPTDASGNDTIAKVCGYLEAPERQAMMRYADALDQGFPIATGAIEGACRYLVKDRMDRTGARWSLAGADAVLRLRALRASGDFDEYWAFHLEQEKIRNHEQRYQDGVIPDPLPPRRPKLRRVK